MATITSSDPKRDVELLIQGLKIAQNRQFPDQSIQQPGESEAYTDKTTYKKPKTEGQKLEESGDYLKDPETEVDTSQPLQIKSNPLDELFIDPKTQRQNVRNRKIQDRAKSKDQGADIAKDKLKPEQKIDIPDFLRNVNIKPQDLLKILQFIPALAGFDLMRADAQGLPQEQLMASMPESYSTNMPQNYRDWSEFHRQNYNEKAPGWLDRMKEYTHNYPQV